MVAITARRVDPAPAPAGPTPFADAALVLRSHGLAPIPLVSEDGKVPRVRYGNWKLLPGRLFLERLVGEQPTANVGILTGLSGVTVVDVDDPTLVPLEPLTPGSLLANFVAFVPAVVPASGNYQLPFLVPQTWPLGQTFFGQFITVEPGPNMLWATNSFPWHTSN